MERFKHLILAAILAFGLASAAESQTTSSSRKAADEKSIDTPRPDERIRTSDQIKGASVEGAATAPLRDLNVVKVRIPEILNTGFAFNFTGIDAALENLTKTTNPH